jgi:hypothetical protein
LFTSALKLCKGSIWVGGGKLWLIYIRTVAISPRDNRYIFLKKTLLVPDLECTLISVKKLAGSDYIGQFDSHRLVFTRRSDYKYIVEAILKGGLYILSKISKKVYNKTFYNTLLKEDKLNIKY